MFRCFFTANCSLRACLSAVLIAGNEELVDSAYIIDARIDSFFTN